VTRATCAAVEWRCFGPLFAELVIASGLVLTGCATTNTVKQTYQPGTDFSRYHTFAMLPVDAGVTNQPTLKPSFALAAREAAIEALTQKGLRAVNEEAADLLVDIAGDAISGQQYYLHRQVYTVQGQVNVYNVDSLTPQIQTHCIVVVELIDRVAKKEVWQGYQTETLQAPADREAIALIVKRILAAYPPSPTTGD